MGPGYQGFVRRAIYMLMLDLLLLQKMREISVKAVESLIYLLDLLLLSMLKESDEPL